MYKPSTPSLKRQSHEKVCHLRQLYIKDLSLNDDWRESIGMLKNVTIYKSVNCYDFLNVVYQRKVGLRKHVKIVCGSFLGPEIAYRMYL